jgi:hypothetical protein
MRRLNVWTLRRLDVYDLIGLAYEPLGLVEFNGRGGLSEAYGRGLPGHGGSSW